MNDPVFSLIEAHKLAAAAHDAALDEKSDLEEKLGVSAPETSCRPAPIRFIHWELSSIEQIEELVGRHLLPGFVELTVGSEAAAQIREIKDKLRRKIMLQWDAAQDQQRRLQEECGWLAVCQNQQLASDVQDAALKHLCETPPTTPEGFAAWVEYLRPWVHDASIEGTWENGATDNLWSNLESSAKRLAA